MSGGLSLSMVGRNGCLSSLERKADAWMGSGGAHVGSRGNEGCQEEKESAVGWGGGDAEGPAGAVGGWLVAVWSPGRRRLSEEGAIKRERLG